MAVLAVFVAACLYNIPRFFERVVDVVPCTAHLGPRARWTSLRENRVYFLVYKTVCYFIFRSIGPLVVYKTVCYFIFRSIGPLVALVVLNSRLAIELRHVDRRRTALRGQANAITATNWKTGRLGGGAGKQHENLTAMLVGVVTVFIICQLPGLGIRVAYTVMEFEFKLDLITLRYANVASNALLVFNSAVNIVVYCLVGKRFRRILLDEMLTTSCCCCSRRSTSSRLPAPSTAMTLVCESRV